jgi:hypothetical protein
MQSWPARRRMLMTRLRMAAMTYGPVPVRAVQASLPKVTSRTQWSWFSIFQWPRTHGELAGAGLGRGQTGDRVAGLGAPFPAAGPTGAAGDLDGLSGVWERQPGGDRNRLDEAAFDAAVGAAVLRVPFGNLFPGQGPELAEQPGLVALGSAANWSPQRNGP